MTDTRTYDVSGATLTVTLVVLQHTISVAMTLDTSALDTEEPDHSAHNLIAYVDLPGWEAPQARWWCRRQRKLTCKTGSQARRIVTNARTKAADAVSAAILNRQRRKAEMAVALS